VGRPEPVRIRLGPAAEPPYLVTLIWIGVILAIFVPLGVRKYRSVSR